MKHKQPIRSLVSQRGALLVDAADLARALVDGEGGDRIERDGDDAVRVDDERYLF